MDMPEPEKTMPLWQRMGIWTLVIVAAFLGVTALGWWRQATAGEDQVAWKHFEVAQEAAEATGKPMLLNFTADWCGPCQRMKATVYSQEHVAEQIEEQFIPVKVDLTAPEEGDIENELAFRYDVQGIPHLVVLSPEGRFLTAGQGFFFSAEEMLEWLEEVPEADERGAQAGVLR